VLAGSAVQVENVESRDNCSSTRVACGSSPCPPRRGGRPGGIPEFRELEDDEVNLLLKRDGPLDAGGLICQNTPIEVLDPCPKS
jgi:hypothetical protein